MTRSLFLFFLLCPLAALFAQDSSYAFSNDVPLELGVAGSFYDPRSRGGVETTTPARMVLPADAVVLKFTVSTESSKPEERLADLRQAYEALQKAAERNDQVVLKTGFMALPLAQGRGYFSSLKSGDEVSSFEVTVVAKLTAADSVFDRMLFLNTFVERVSFPKYVKAYFQSSGIALLEPDRYRSDLVKMVGNEYQLMKTTFGEDVSITVKGLDQRVLVRVVDNRNIEVSLPYAMEVEVGDREDD